MNSPFHKKMIDKNPIKQLHTVQRMIAAAKAADENFYKNIDPYEAEGNRLEASEPLAIDDPTSYDYDYDQNPETTAKKKTEVDSPLDYAYVSTAPHFQRLQDNIARAFTPTKDSKSKAEKEAEFKGKTEKVSKKLKQTAEKGFKDYSAEAEFNSKSGSAFDRDDNNIFNRFGQ